MCNYLQKEELSARLVQQLFHCQGALPCADGRQKLVHWPFTTSDLFNWKLQNPKFSEKPAKLIDLLGSVLFTHIPTWDDCYQLLRVLSTMEEREQILA